MRGYRLGEEAELWQIYHDTTHIVNGSDYTAEQCERWAPALPDMEHWCTRLARTQPFVAESDGQLVGFAELNNAGEIEFFYCRHDFQRKGASKLLCAAIEAEAKRLGFTQIIADVSVTAKRYFLARGFEVVREQSNIVCGAPAPNSVMRKLLVS